MCTVNDKHCELLAMDAMKRLYLHHAMLSSKTYSARRTFCGYSCSGRLHLHAIEVWIYNRCLHKTPKKKTHVFVILAATESKESPFDCVQIDNNDGIYTACVNNEQMMFML